MIRLFSALALTLWASVAFAQQNTVRLCVGTVTNCVPVSATYPLPITSAGGGTSGLAVTQTPATTTMAAPSVPTPGTFVSVLASSATRKACLIQNSGATLGYVYFGVNGSATTANSFQLQSGQSISCTNNNITSTDNVSATCASGTCAFIVASQ